MLVRFSSVETESITMFGDVATQLIKMLGASGQIPGAISAKDIPQAIERLRSRLRVEPAPVRTPRPDDKFKNEEEKERERPVSLATRAVPLLGILERASKADVPVMWEKG